MNATSQEAPDAARANSRHAPHVPDTCLKTVAGSKSNRLQPVTIR
jgi:hypothetical protein